MMKDIRNANAVVAQHSHAGMTQSADVKEGSTGESTRI